MSDRAQMNVLLRQSIVETRGVDSLSVLTDKIQDVVGWMDVFPDSLVQALFTLAETVDKARNHPSPIDFQSAVFRSVFPCYISAVASSSAYYLSDVELLCLCHCAYDTY